MREHMNNTKIIFLNKNNLSDYLIQDNDNYYKTFNNNDMIVRNIKNINEYYQIINKSVVDSNDIIRNKILKCIKKIENKFNNKNYEYFNGNKFNNITWKIGFIKGKLYEEGLPHTRDQVIILPIEYVESINNDTLIRLLIHEKIHVYQKIYHDDI
jgi:predicted metalloprotease with PDZ domain